VSPARILALLTLLNFFNYLDRLAVYSLFPLIKTEFMLTDRQLGLLGTACLLILAIMALPMGWLADRFGARLIITICATLWSISAGASALARSFVGMLGFRAVVGIGEAGYEPAAHATLCSLFPEKKAQALGIFNLGTALGAAGGIAVAGLLASVFGWRGTLFLLALPGLALAVLAWKQLAALPLPVKHHNPPLRALIGVRSATLGWLLLGGTVAAFTAGCLQAWLPTFVVRYHHTTLGEAGLILAVVAVGGGAAGVLSGGFLADQVQKRRPGGRALAVAVAFGFATPVGLWATHASTKGSFMLGAALTCVTLTFYAGPVVALIDDVVPRHFAATAQAGFLLISHLFGDAFAPTIIGALADVVGQPTGLRRAFLLPVFAASLACFSFYMASRSHARDQQRALDMEAAAKAEAAAHAAAEAAPPAAAGEPAEEPAAEEPAAEEPAAEEPAAAGAAADAADEPAAAEQPAAAVAAAS
jgi:MFS family permease